MATHPFRFGVTAFNSPSLGEWEELAVQAEDLGYSTLLLGDHFVEHQPVGGASPLQALTLAAQATERLRLGSLVLGNDYRHPAMLAKETATVDLMSAGRLELGLGAGWLRSDYDALGLTFDSARTRIDRLAEAIHVIRQSWRGEPFDFAGDHYRITNYRGIPRPAQDPGPPIAVGGGSPRVLRLAGKEADIVGIHASMRKGLSAELATDTTDARIEEKICWIKEGAGARFADLELQMICDVAITTDRRAAAASKASLIGATVEEVLSSNLELIGTVEEVAEALRARRDRFGVSYVIIPDHAYEDFAPVVSLLTGT